MSTFTNEKQGQDSFYLAYLPRVDKTLTKDQILNDYTDGVVRGNILEFKLQISNLNSTLFQAIKYLSAMRIKGKPVPKNILLVSLNDDKCYVYDSKDYLSEIQKVYIGGASTNNLSFVGKSPLQTIDMTTMVGEAQIITLLKQNYYTKIGLKSQKETWNPCKLLIFICIIAVKTFMTKKMLSLWVEQHDKKGSREWPSKMVLQGLQTIFRRAS